MGAKDMERQALNVFRMRLCGAEVRGRSWTEGRRWVALQWRASGGISGSGVRARMGLLSAAGL